jgi:hypothetical protein
MFACVEGRWKKGVLGARQGAEKLEVYPEHATGIGRSFVFSYKGPPLQVRGLSLNFLNHNTCIKYCVLVAVPSA